MTVSELISKLQQLPTEVTVFMLKPELGPDASRASPIIVDFTTYVFLY